MKGGGSEEKKRCCREAEGERAGSFLLFVCLCTWVYCICLCICGCVCFCVWLHLCVHEHVFYMCIPVSVCSTKDSVCLPSSLPHTLSPLIPPNPYSSSFRLVWYDVLKLRNSVCSLFLSPSVSLSLWLSFWLAFSLCLFIIDCVYSCTSWCCALQRSPERHAWTRAALWMGAEWAKTINLDPQSPTTVTLDTPVWVQQLSLAWWAWMGSLCGTRLCPPVKVNSYPPAL